MPKTKSKLKQLKPETQQTLPGIEMPKLVDYQGQRVPEDIAQALRAQAQREPQDRKPEVPESLEVKTKEISPPVCPTPMPEETGTVGNPRKKSRYFFAQNARVLKGGDILNVLKTEGQAETREEIETAARAFLQEGGVEEVIIARTLAVLRWKKKITFSMEVL